MWCSVIYRYAIYILIQKKVKIDVFNVRLAGGHLYGKQLFTWLSLVVSLMASFVLSFFPIDVLDEIWDLIESVSEGFLTYSRYSRAQPIATVHFLIRGINQALLLPL